MDSDDRILDVIGVLIAFGLLFGLVTLVFFGGPGPANPDPSAPDANWTAARINATHAQLAHTGGDAVASADLALTVDGDERSVPWSGEVAEGDVGVVRAEAGDPIELYWTGASDDRASLGRWTP